MASLSGSKISDLFTWRLATVLHMKTNFYFIDRESELFWFVLQSLRDGTLAVPDNFQLYLIIYDIISNSFLWSISLDHCKGFELFQGMGTARKISGFMEFIWITTTHKIKGMVIKESVNKRYKIHPVYYFSLLSLFDIFHIKWSLL